jgi:hypothetical protein
MEAIEIEPLIRTGINNESLMMLRFDVREWAKYSNSDI